MNPERLRLALRSISMEMLEKIVPDLRGGSFMTIRLGDEAPDFSAEATDGPIDFHSWKQGKGAVLFSHPKDFTPVCTTELGAVAKLKPEFDKRGTKLTDLSVDNLDSHQRWQADI